MSSSYSRKRGAYRKRGTSYTKPTLNPAWKNSDRIHPDMTFEEAKDYVEGYDVDVRLLPEKFQHNRDIILAAINQNPRYLETCPAEFQNDPEIVCMAAAKDFYAFTFASDELKSDKKFILERGLPAQIGVYKFVPKECYEDRDFFNKVFEVQPYAYKCAPDDVKHEREVMLSAVSRSADLIREVPEQYKFDRELVRAAFKNCPESAFICKYVPKELCVCEEFIASLMMEFLVKTPEEQNDPSLDCSRFSHNPERRKIVKKAFDQWIRMLNYYEKHYEDEKYHPKYQDVSQFIIECPYLPQREKKSQESQ